MGEFRSILSKKEEQFREILWKLLKAADFLPGHTEATPSEQRRPDLLLHRGAYTYCVEIKYSRTRLFPGESAVSVYSFLEACQKHSFHIPLVVIGGELSDSLKAAFLEVCPRTVVIDIRNLLHMAGSNRELYDELTAQLPYSVSGLMPSAPDFRSAPAPRPFPSGTTNNRGSDSSGFNSPPFSNTISRDDPYHITGNPGTGKSDTLRRLAESAKAAGSEALQEELRQWQGGKGTALSIQYEKLCTRVLKRLFSDDLTLWQEQAKSNDELYRFDLICKIKRDNQKDFWEMAERHFHSKYIIFEFKNYSGTVTQMEVTTTARYLYTKALRSVAIIVSPNGFSVHADKAARGALREEGKLLLPLTNAELIGMLQMQDNGEYPADYLSDKLDSLLIDLEK